MNLIPNWKLPGMSPKDLTRYYTKIRKEALRRLRVLNKNKMLDYIDDRPTITTARGKEPGEILNEAENINKFLSNKFSSIRYVQKFERDMVAWAHENGYDNITKENVRDFNLFMKKLKPDFEEYIYDSDRSATIFDEAMRLNINMTPEDLADNIEYLEDNLEALKDIAPVKNNKPMTARELRKRVTLWKKQQGIK